MAKKKSSTSSGSKAKAGTSTYSPNSIAKQAVTQLRHSLLDRTGKRMAVNSLNEYATDATLRNDYAPYTNEAGILNRYNNASDAAYALSKQEQIQAMNAAEDQNYSNTKSAIQQMRQTLAGSAVSGASRGAANATALQALLGLGQQNAATTTEAMQGYQNTAREAAAARAQNAVQALQDAKSGMDSMYTQATSAYNSDHLYGNQGIADATGTIASAMDTNQSSERMNNATNRTNASIANTETKSKQTIINKK